MIMTQEVPALRPPHNFAPATAIVYKLPGLCSKGMWVKRGRPPRASIDLTKDRFSATVRPSHIGMLKEFRFAPC